MQAQQFSHERQLSFDIFCRVIDNYGDIGVCWRLARQLAQLPYNCDVRLWVDDLKPFQRLEPGISTTLEQQKKSGITIVHWRSTAPVLRPNDIVIEAFGCSPPADFIAAMVNTNSLWLNLEYLSAEPWVSGFHLQPSVQPGRLRKYFFFPGFSCETGGLLREPDLIGQRRAWRSQPARRDALLQSCGVSAADIHALNQGARLVYIFCYPDAPVPTLIETLARQSTRTIVLIPQGVYPPGKLASSEHVRIVHIPFVSQADFDRLLWSADLNIVRGEDSLVRALWAARPMIWQPYAQDDDTHIVKLNAWLARSCLHADTQALIRSWTLPDPALLRHELRRHQQPDVWARWVEQSEQWSCRLSQQTDLATALVRFCTQYR